MPMVSEIVAGAVIILLLAAGLRRVLVLRGRLGALISVTGAGVILALLGMNGIGTEMVDHATLRSIGENLWVPAAMFAGAVLFASVA